MNPFATDILKWSFGEEEGNRRGGGWGWVGMVRGVAGFLFFFTFYFLNILIFNNNNNKSNSKSCDFLNRKVNEIRKI